MVGEFGEKFDAGRGVEFVAAHQRLQRELARQQTLTRLTQRSLGLAPPPPPPPAKGGRKKRRRRPTARALQVAARLQTDSAPLPQLPKSLQQLTNS